MNWQQLSKEFLGSLLSGLLSRAYGLECSWLYYLEGGPRTADRLFPKHKKQFQEAYLLS